MPRGAAIFDLDGTILDTLQDLTDSLNQALSSKGYPTFDCDAVRLMIGNGVSKLVKRALTPIGFPKSEEYEPDPGVLEPVRAAFKAEYAARQLNKTKPFEGVPELLDELKRRGLSLAVFSNKDHENTKMVIRHFFPGVFKVVQGAERGTPLKPDPAGALKVLAALGASAKDALYVGDTAVDMITAKAASLTALGVGWGFRPPRELLDAGAEAVLYKPSELLSFLDGGS